MEYVCNRLADLYIRNALMVGIAMVEESLDHIESDTLSEKQVDLAVEALKPLMIELRKSCLRSINDYREEIIDHVKSSTAAGIKEGWEND
jgi:3-isopropylmalate dehydratase small subunit